MKKEQQGVEGRKRKIPEQPIERRAREQAGVIAAERAMKETEHRLRQFGLENGVKSSAYRSAYRDTYQEIYRTEFDAAFRSRLSELIDEQSM